MRKQPSTVLADRLINMPVDRAYPYCQHEVETAGHNFHEALFLALEKMSKDIKKDSKLVIS